MWRRRFSVFVGALFGFFLVACERSGDHAAQESQPELAREVAPDDSSLPAPKPPQEFQVGRWSGAGQLGSAAPLSIELQVDEAGRVSGKAQSGQRLAELSGVYDDAQIRATFSGERMTGTLLLSKKEPEFIGQVRLSLVERAETKEEFHAVVSDLILKKQN